MIILKPMTKEAYQAFIETSFKAFLQEMQKGSSDSAEFRKRLAEMKKQMLPQGLATPNHFFYDIYDQNSQKEVGELWFAIEERGNDRSIFVYDIRIHDAHRRKGFGSQAFQTMEKKAREMGIDKITLHVFGNNHPARNMYKKLGYTETDVMMSKTIY